MRRLALVVVVGALCACDSSDTILLDASNVSNDDAGQQPPAADSGGGGAGGDAAGSGGSGAGSGSGSGSGSGGNSGAGAGGMGPGPDPNPPVDAGMDSGPPPAAGQSLIVGVSDFGMRGRSPDGKSWTYCANPGSGDPHSPDLLRNIAYGAGVFLAVGGDMNGMVMRSLDGEHWQEDVHPTNACKGEGWPNSCTNWMGAVAFDDGLFLAGGGNGALMRSSDGGLTWTGLGGKFPNTKHIRSMGGGSGRFVAGTDGGGVVVTKNDGDSWTVAVQPSSKSYPMIEYGGGTFIAHANPEFNMGDCNVSTNAGDTWEPCADAVKASVSFVYDGARWVTRANGGYATSTDGKAWTMHAASNVPQQLLYDGAMWFGRSGKDVFNGKSPDSFTKVAMGVQGYRGWVVGKVLASNLPVIGVPACTDKR